MEEYHIYKIVYSPTKCFPRLTLFCCRLCRTLLELYGTYSAEQSLLASNMSLQKLITEEAIEDVIQSLMAANYEIRR